MLQAQLPAYMVPQSITVLDAMLINQNGKVDRQALAQRRQEQAVSRGLVQQPTSEAERRMQQLWARVLGIELESIGLDDSFFRLGGDSIAAMKLVGEAHRQGLRLIVADVFNQPDLEHLARVQRSSFTDPADSVRPFSLLPPGVKESLFSLLHLDSTAIQHDNVVDILPTTYAQHLFITRGVADPRVAFNYVFLDLGQHLDVARLKNSCWKLIDHFQILRTQFAFSQGRLWQIVLRDIGLPFTTFNVDGQVDKELHEICMADVKQVDPLELPISFSLVRSGSVENRLIVRLSHAQYDGVCLPIILETLVSIYHQKPLHPTVGFPTYLAYARKQDMASSRYWRNLLRGSRLTKATAKICPKVPEATPRMIVANMSIDAPCLPQHLTTASLVSSAWAVVLSSITGDEDVVYGQLVAGRNSDIPGIAEIVGPCLNEVPVRAVTSPTKTSEELIQSVQNQYVSLGQSDAMGLDEIVRQCTDWPAGSMLDSVVQHQNIDMEHQTHFAGSAAKVQWFINPFVVAPKLMVVSQPEGDKLKLAVAGNTDMVAADMVPWLLDVLVETITALSSNLDVPLASCKSSLPACASSAG